jgi:hypothetical protein
VGFLRNAELRDEDDEEQFFIVYNPVTLLILGVTSNCHRKFGIPASLAYGNQANSTEFTLSKLFFIISRFYYS